MATVTKKRCQRIGCDAMFSPDDNPEDFCQHHPLSLNFTDSDETDTQVSDSLNTKEIFALVFGESDTDDDFDAEDEAQEITDNSDIDDDFADEDKAQELGANRMDEWVKVDEVEGLWHCNQFLSTQEQTLLLKAIAAEGWFEQPQNNQAMRFGDLPDWALELCDLIRNSIRSYKSASTTELPEDVRNTVGPLPNRILEREPLFDQMIANSYQPGEGIKAHVDLMQFEDGIAIVSLESTCVMSFALVGDGAESSTDIDTSQEHEDSMTTDGGSHPWSSLIEPNGKVIYVCERHQKSGLANRVDLLLKPGDLVVSYGPARYLWTHEIDRRKDKQVWFGQTIEQQRRISVTLRRLGTQSNCTISS